ncbi:MAG: hypothetical protein V5B40_22485 [Candidatus Accumulibacter meliphilus]|jgi:hypothetical protein|uniref:hypothetical protein n=1 Tax=Candidatus Accumulibacter meliphilus TaxID=2211374 RepID=UPI002FC35799
MAVTRGGPRRSGVSAAALEIADVVVQIGADLDQQRGEQGNQRRLPEQPPVCDQATAWPTISGATDTVSVLGRMASHQAPRGDGGTAGSALRGESSGVVAI